jgi:hypothetical protein
MSLQESNMEEVSIHVPFETYLNPYDKPASLVTIDQKTKNDDDDLMKKCAELSQNDVMRLAEIEMNHIKVF